ncbi:PREDICTED: hydroxylysine kinase-like [Amphimedon queenslandica]|nr:PREDICTED: hydroxylysine kinase-like [Amphimedon queenslandica]|eukprot:XP_019856668.1 PREDICTED: hydroxylysine kinase-like [Amphimedon queenslandica]
MMADIRPPSLSPQGVVKLLNDYFPFKHIAESSVKELNSYDDRNYYFRGHFLGNIPKSEHSSSENEFVLKVLNWRDSEMKSTVEMQTEVKKFLFSKGINVPFPVASVNGTEIVTLSGSSLFSYSEVSCDSQAAQYHYHARVLTYLPGKLLSDVFVSPSVMFQLGEYIGSVSREMKLFSHPGASARKLLQWDLQHLLTLRSLADKSISDLDKLQVIHKNFHDFEENVVPMMPTLPHSICHNDLNDMNIIVEENQLGDVEVVGLIDFNDCVYTPTVFDLGIAMAYASLERPDPLKSVAPLLSGYLKENPLTEKEINLLYYVILGRLTQTCVNGEYTYHSDPSNKYILTHLKPAWETISKIQATGKKVCDEIWHDAASKTLKDYLFN